ncbi:UNVERIFIED_CONTAM: hypothetical protein Slati_3683500 [Sesamum latifolium]|uniref:Uncharacterized protein n=1 Tax=Sesamum latifolium TaxID=2727402 RepID=A0AAW2U1R1_9LAMI
MGVRDLGAFNTALIAKQAWRILTKPDNLLSKILKARYLPYGSFMEAGLGYNPSSTWRSIWRSQPLIRDGCRWCIGDGKSVRIWGDLWLPRPHSFRPLHVHNAIPWNARVDYLIDQERHCWIENVINNNFTSEDAEQINTLPLATHGIKDTLVGTILKMVNSQSGVDTTFKGNYVKDSTTRTEAQPVPITSLGGNSFGIAKCRIKSKHLYGDFARTPSH